jgi:dipeptidyl aminopeptidase/acylaminoacyl peptidase
VSFVRSRDAGRRGVYLGRIDQPTVPGTMLFQAESEATLVCAGTSGDVLLLTATEGHVDIRRFDNEHLAVVGDPVRLPVPAAANSPHHGAMLSASQDVLAYVATPLPYGARLASVRVTGEDLQHEAVHSIVNWPRVSPDGTRRAAARLDPVTGVADLWVEDLERGTRTRVTYEPLSAQLPVWSPDSARLAYVSGFTSPTLAIAAADGTGGLGTIPCPRARCEPTDWSADGAWLVVTVRGPGNDRGDVWLLPVGGAGEPRPLLSEPYAERDARLSPDGHLLAYVSDESGRPEVSLRSLDGAPRRVVISPGGGSQPVWTRDGRKLLFVDPDGALRRVPVRIAADGRPGMGPATRLAVPPIGIGHWSTQYDLSPDEQSLHFLDGQPGASPRDIGFVLGWRGFLK